MKAAAGFVNMFFCGSKCWYTVRLNTPGNRHVELSRQSRAAQTGSGQSSRLRRTEVNISVKSGSVQRGQLAEVMAVIY